MFSVFAIFLILVASRAKSADQEPALLPGPGVRAFSLQFATDGQQLAVTYEDGSFRIWTLGESSPSLVRDGAHSAPSRSILWDAIASTVFTAGDEGRIVRWNARDGHAIGSPIQADRPYRITLIGNNRLAAACRDGAIPIYDLATGTVADRLQGHQGPVRDVTVTHDGRTLASVGHDATLRLWDTAEGKQLKAVSSGQGGRLFTVAIAPDNSRAAYAGDGGRIRVVSLPDGEPQRDWQAHDREIRSLSFSRDGRFLASAGEDVEVRLWDVQQGTLVKALSGRSGKAYGVAFSPAADTLAVARADGHVELWRDLAP